MVILGTHPVSYVLEISSWVAKLVAKLERARIKCLQGRGLTLAQSSACLHDVLTGRNPSGDATNSPSEHIVKELETASTSITGVTTPLALFETPCSEATFISKTCCTKAVLVNPGDFEIGLIDILHHDVS